MKHGDSIDISGTHSLSLYDVCKLKIAGVVDSISPYTSHNYQLLDYNTAIIVVLSKEMYQKEIEDKTISRSDIYISTKNPYEIDKKLTELSDADITKENLYDERLEEESTNNLISFMLYAFEIMINVFCLMNIFYIVLSSMNFRRKDFAVLKSIGMSDKQVDKMLILECILYGFSGIIFGTILSIGFLYLLGKFVLDGDLYLFKLPIIHILYVTIIVYLVIFFAMIITRQKIKKGNIIDDVRLDNV